VFILLRSISIHHVLFSPCFFNLIFTTYQFFFEPINYHPLTLVVP